MTKTLFTFALALSLASPSIAQAGHKGSISFSAGERAQHEANQETVLRAAASCLNQQISRHQSFFRQYGISPFYGDRSTFGKLSYAGKQNYLRQIGKNPALLSQMKPTSCVGITLTCLGQGFAAAGQNNLWAKIRSFTLLNGADGTAMQAGLQALGWKIFYWNPDTRRNQSWDAQERANWPDNKDRVWGYHEENWRAVSRNSRYLYNRVDDGRSLVNFGQSTPAILRSTPFFVGTAHGGYHVFPGTSGRVIESHSTRRINDPNTMESAPFNPLGGQAPTNGSYKSGLIAIPARYAR